VLPLGQAIAGNGPPVVAHSAQTLCPPSTMVSARHRSEFGAQNKDPRLQPSPPFPSSTVAWRTGCNRPVVGKRSAGRVNGWATALPSVRTIKLAAAVTNYVRVRWSGQTNHFPKMEVRTDELEQRS